MAEVILLGFGDINGFGAEVGADVVLDGKGKPTTNDPAGITDGFGDINGFGADVGAEVIFIGTGKPINVGG